MTSRPQLSEEHLQLAAEHALGLLSGADRRRALGLQSEDPQFREEVGRWYGRLAPLLDELPHVAPPSSVWAGVESRIEEPGTHDGTVVALRRRVTVWRAATAAATALAASLALLLLLRPEPVAPPVPVETPAAPPLVAMMPTEDGPALLATWHPDDRRLTVAASGEMPAEPGRSHELWVIPAGGQPLSLGILQVTPRAQMRVEQAVANQLRQGATLAVSVEPEGGSPTGLPTGPVIATGALGPV